MAYAPRGVRRAWTGLIALDRRLGDAARAGRDPIMIQLRLAWWRDRLAEPAAQWPTGEPLLAALAVWDAERAALGALVDGREAAVVGEDGGVALDQARADAIAALVRLAGGIPDGVVVAAALAWAKGEALPSQRLPRVLRPLILLDHFHRHADAPPWRALLGAIRKGWFGR